MRLRLTTTIYCTSAATQVYQLKSYQESSRIW